MTEYLTPAGFGEAEYTEKRSRFIGHVWHVESEEEATAHIKETREKYWDARHNVYAYILRGGNLMRYSDDGEPQGTSGMPTLNVFRGEEIVDVCCVVTRYFGGVLLGTGGLVRAYTQAAKAALENAGTAVVRLWKQFDVDCAYNQLEKIKYELEGFDAVTEDTVYGAGITIKTLIPEQRADDFVLRMTDISAGTVTPRLTGETLRAVKIR